MEKEDRVRGWYDMNSPQSVGEEWPAEEVSRVIPMLAISDFPVVEVNKW